MCGQAQLTYQSKECVKLVVDAYLELLASDRSLLVPILGSLADLPLDPADKSAVLDATEVRSVVTIIPFVQARADLTRRRAVFARCSSGGGRPGCCAELAGHGERADRAANCRQAARGVQSGGIGDALPRVRGALRQGYALRSPLWTSSAHCRDTLHVNNAQVIGRFAVAGSSTLNAFLQVLRRAEPLTPFDVVLLAHLMGKSTENEVRVLGLSLRFSTAHLTTPLCLFRLRSRRRRSSLTADASS